MLSVELFEAIPQWRLARMQLVNWGTFHNYHSTEFEFSTLISGPSGSGKSSLLDAYTALMMESNTPFNGASNEGSGRARGKDQRSALSYIRGAIDTVRDDETGELIDDILRGKNSATWSAIAATFRNDDGRHFTALRLYYARVGASSASDLTMRMLTTPGDLNLKDIEEFAAAKFLPRELLGRYPAMRNHDSYATFAQALYTQLGIGHNGNGARAMKLLARIQGGHDVKSVDALYKQLVLEKPETYKKADVVISHFDDLARTHEAMLTAAQKVDVLKDMPRLHADMTSAQREIETVDSFRINGDGPTPFRLWKLKTRSTLLDQVVDSNRAEYIAAQQAFREASIVEENRKLQLDQIAQDERANGGHALERLKNHLDDLAIERDAASVERMKFYERVAILNHSSGLETQEEFDSLAQYALEFISSYDDQDMELTAKQDGIKHDLWTIQAERKLLAREHESLLNRSTKLPLRYIEARAKIADCAGIDQTELPFVAELIDIRPEHERWRPAMELVMRGFSLTLFVDERAAERLRSSIDTLALRDRIRFRAIPTGISGATASPGTLASMLNFAESPYGGWLQLEVSRRFDYECVETARDFTSGSRKQLTLAGQVKDGPKGAHGGITNENIIGFSNESYRQQLALRLDGLDRDLEQLDIEIAVLNDHGKRQQLIRQAFQYVLDSKWQEIDVLSLDAHIASTEAERARLWESNSILAALEVERIRLEEEHREANRLRVTAESAAERLQREYGPLVTRQDDIFAEITATAEAVRLTDDQQIHLDEVFAEHGVPGDFELLTDSFNKVKRHLDDRARGARQRETAVSESLIRVFDTYQRTWPNSDLGITTSSYEDYQSVLDELIAEGLPERRSDFKREMAQWTGRDLIPLAHSMRESVNHIEERLNEVNEILASIPFGPEQDRLRISLRRLPTQPVRLFLKRLNRIAEGATATYESEETDARFKEIDDFVMLIRPSGSLPKGVICTRDTYLDVHRHLTITAERTNEHGVQLSVYDSLGGKSGGETQELVAFIVGAALRYQLGDEESSTRPRFAPVLLDEGFIKADAEFAGRGVHAWKRLGFQLIIAAPLDKVTGIEMHVDLMLGVNKPGKFSLINRIRAIDEPVSEKARSMRATDAMESE